MADTKTQFTKEEEARIQAAVNDYEKKAREEMIETEIRNRILDAQNSQAGHRY